APLVGNDTALRIDTMVAVETGGYLLIQCRVWQQIARNLLDSEAVEGNIAIISLNHPIAPAPLEPLEIRLIAVAVGITRSIHPAYCHLFPVAWRRQQTLYDLFVSVGR